MLQSLVTFWVSAEKVSAPLAELCLCVGVVPLNGFSNPLTLSHSLEGVLLRETLQNSVSAAVSG